MSLQFDHHEISIREEDSVDISSISCVVEAAFSSMELSSHTEQYIVNALREANVLAISLVAVLHQTVIGHIAFSPVEISDGSTDWYGLGPVSVLPDYQRQGVGKALIQEGLERLKQLHANGCCLVGHPEYYRQFGFENVHGLLYEGVPEEVFFALLFNHTMPQGTVKYHHGFNAVG